MRASRRARPSALRPASNRTSPKPPEISAADKGYDSAENNAELYDDHGIKPVINTRKLWKSKRFETLYPDRYDFFCHDESGKVYCSCPSERKGEEELRPRGLTGRHSKRTCSSEKP